MPPNLIRASYSWQSLPDLLDILAVLVSLGTVLGVTLLMWQAVFLLLRRPRRRWWRRLLWVIALSGLTYAALYIKGAPAILAVLAVPGSDVPIDSIIRTTALNVMLLAVAYVLNRTNLLGDTDAPR
ncbi:hypothetical protein [Deinococcus sp.]|uniref:hypothetical protein n=1 Tax=Deinococcus sp. TaxID=47478 RepID=UPI0025FB8385|nr:hypothetical protein [Deinococcus sp.]